MSDTHTPEIPKLITAMTEAVPSAAFGDAGFEVEWRMTGPRDFERIEVWVTWLDAEGDMSRFDLTPDDIVDALMHLGAERDHLRRALEMACYDGITDSPDYYLDETATGDG